MELFFRVTSLYLCLSTPKPESLHHLDQTLGDPNASRGSESLTMFPEPTPPPPPASSVQSSSIAQAWLCNCGCYNMPVVTTCFVVSRCFCERCGTPGTHDFDFSFTDLRPNGIPVLPEVRDQGDLPTCTIHSTLAAMQILIRRAKASMFVVFNKTLQWIDVLMKYQFMKQCVFNGLGQTDRCMGRMEGMLDVVKKMGVVDEDGVLYRIKSWRWYNHFSMPFHQVCALLAEGVPVLTIVPFYPHMIELKENDVYSTNGLSRQHLIEYHAVVLFSGLRECGKEMFRFLDSHGAHSHVNGIAKVYREECVFGFFVITM